MDGAVKKSLSEPFNINYIVPDSLAFLCFSFSVSVESSREDIQILWNINRTATNNTVVNQ
jgi:hypothetical protein